MPKTKSILLDDEMHRDLKKIQAILYEKYDIEMRMLDILYYAVKKAGMKRHDIFAEEIATGNISEIIPNISILENNVEN